MRALTPPAGLSAAVFLTIQTKKRSGKHEEEILERKCLCTWCVKEEESEVDHWSRGGFLPARQLKYKKLEIMVRLFPPMQLKTLLLTQSALLAVFFVHIFPPYSLAEAEEAAAIKSPNTSLLPIKEYPFCSHICNALVDGLQRGTAVCRLDSRRAANPRAFIQNIFTSFLLFSPDNEIFPPRDCCNCGAKQDLVTSLVSSSSSSSSSSRKGVVHGGESVCVETAHPDFPFLSCIISSLSFPALSPSDKTARGPPVLCSTHLSQPPPPPPLIRSARDVDPWINHLVNNYKVVLFTKSYCPLCDVAVHALEALTSGVCTAEIDQSPFSPEIQEALQLRTGAATVPRVFIGGFFVGGCEEVLRLDEQGKLHALLKKADAII
ncbi:hypothetical protein Emag_002584 [Eimeria magna]